MKMERKHPDSQLFKGTDAVAQIVKMLVEDTNIYVKPHPVK